MPLGGWEGGWEWIFFQEEGITYPAEGQGAILCAQVLLPEALRWAAHSVF